MSGRKEDGGGDAILSKKNSAKAQSCERSQFENWPLRGWHRLETDPAGGTVGARLWKILVTTQRSLDFNLAGS